MTKMIRTT